MDGRHVDQIAKSLADGVSRRATFKAIAAALGLSTVGVLGRSSTTVAQETYRACEYNNGSRTRVRCVSSSPGGCPAGNGPWNYAGGSCCYTTRTACRNSCNACD